jgi:ABC-type Fe3+/spermidine/putrescine transport system ATPase subunit
VKQVVYLGASTHYIVELEGGGKLVLYQQNAFDAAGPSEGDGVSVSWDAQNCLILGG